MVQRIKCLYLRFPTLHFFGRVSSVQHGCRPGLVHRAWMAITPTPCITTHGDWYAHFQPLRRGHAFTILESYIFCMDSFMIMGGGQAFPIYGARPASVIAYLNCLSIAGGLTHGTEGLVYDVAALQSKFLIAPRTKTTCCMPRPIFS
jgi:hypothetical protein